MIHRLPEPDDNRRSVPLMPYIDPAGARFVISRRDPVKKVPEGTYVAMMFRVTGFDQDCDGSLMVRLECVDRYGEITGFKATHLGLYEHVNVVLDNPGDLHDLIQD